MGMWQHKPLQQATASQYRRKNPPPLFPAGNALQEAAGDKNKNNRFISTAGVRQGHRRQQKRHTNILYAQNHEQRKN